MRADVASKEGSSVGKWAAVNELDSTVAKRTRAGQWLKKRWMAEAGCSTVFKNIETKELAEGRSSILSGF